MQVRNPKLDNTQCKHGLTSIDEQSLVIASCFFGAIRVIKLI